MVAVFARAYAVTLLVVLTGLAGLAPAADAASVTVESSKLSEPLVGASAVHVDGKTFVFGGRLREGPYSQRILGYESATQALSVVGQLPSGLSSAVEGEPGRYSGTAAAFGSKVYYFGGAQLVSADVNGDGNKEQVPKSSRDVIEFDPATGNARLLHDKLPLGAWGMSSVVANGKIWLFGGFTFDITDLPSTGRHDWVLRFDPTLPEPTPSTPGARFSQIASTLPYPVQDAAAAVLGKRVLIMGGLSDHTNETNPCPTYTFYNSQTGSEETRQITVCLTKRIVSFDPEQQLVVGVAGELPYRAQFISAATVGGKAYVAGGCLSDGSASASILEVALDRSGVPNVRTLVPTLPRGAFGQAVASDGETILLTGGRTSCDSAGSDTKLTDEIVRLDPRATAPWTPRSATASEIVGGVRLAWEAPSYNGDSAITGYRIYRAEAGGQETQLTETTALTYDDKSVKPGTEYSWRISAVNVAGESLQSARVSRSSGVTTPGPVASFQAFPGNGEVILRWRAPEETGGSNLTGYRLFRDDRLLVSLPPDATEHVDRTASNEETYTYRVRAYNAKGDGAASEPIRVTPAPVPRAPSGVFAEVVTQGSGTAVRVTWAPADAVDRYVVLRSDRPGLAGRVVANLSSSDAAYVDTTVVRGQTYYYSVAGENGVGRSPPSAESSASLVREPGAPTELRAFGTEGEVRLTWTPPEDTGDAPPGTLRYSIRRSTGAGSPVIIKTDLENTLYVDRLVTPNQAYTYTVTALNPIASQPSAPATATPSVIQNKPPIAFLAALPPIAAAGDPVELDASNSADVDGTIRTYRYDFGDGTDATTTTSPTVTHQFHRNGTYNVTVVVTDDRGDTAGAHVQVIVGEVVTDNFESGVPGRAPPSDRAQAPGSQTPGIPGPGPVLVLLLVVAVAALRRR